MLQCPKGGASIRHGTFAFVRRLFPRRRAAPEFDPFVGSHRGCPCSPVLPPGYYPNETFYFLPNARNTYRFKPRPIVYSSEGDLTLPPEPNPATSAKWTPTPPLSVRYVDDGCTIDKVNFETAEKFGAMGGERPGRVKHAVASQNVFRSVVRRATNIGMRVNTAKTNLLVISDALTYDPAVFIEDSQGERIISGEGMKVLGFTFSRRPSVAAHVEALIRRVRRRYWILIHLRTFGFSEDELARVYRTIVRPVFDHCAVVYHSMLTDSQDEELDRCQAHALRYIYG